MPRFVPGNKFSRGAPKGTNNGGGTVSKMHREECRRLVEELKIREFFGDVTSGAEVDFFVTIRGKRVKVPANMRNRIQAGVILMEQGYGKAPQELQHTIDPTLVQKFEAHLLKIFQQYIAKQKCAHCGTLTKLPPELAREVMELSRIFENQPTAKAEAPRATGT